MPAHKGGGRPALPRAAESEGQLSRSQSQHIQQLQVTKGKGRRAALLTHATPQQTRGGASSPKLIPSRGSLCHQGETWSQFSTVPPVAVQSSDICMAFGGMGLRQQCTLPLPQDQEPRHSPQQQPGPGCPHDLRWQRKSSLKSACPPVVAWPSDIHMVSGASPDLRHLLDDNSGNSDTDPSCSRITDLDMALGDTLGPSP